MDPSLYKDFKTSRGFNWHYYAKAPTTEDKPTLLFIHGFPSTSNDWRHQVAFFGGKGYGLVVPDMLGWGGTDKPLDVAQYGALGMAKDMIEILEHEKVGKCIAIGHDWGVASLSILAMLFTDHFVGFAWLSVHHIEPAALDYNAMIKQLNQAFGYDVFGYWSFFDSPDAADVTEKHIDSFLDLLYASDPLLWKTWLAPTGKLREWLENDMHTTRAAYMTDEDYNYTRSTFLRGGLKAPMLYYSNHIHNISREEDLAIPKEKYEITKPAFFAPTHKDCVCLPAVGKQGMQKNIKPELLTTVDFDTSHWLQLEAPDKLNKELEAWIGKAVIQ